MKPHRWILLAEDNPHDAELTIRALTVGPPSVEVLLTRDGQEALDCLFRREKFRDAPAELPTLLLLDLKMPRVDGLQVLEQVKNDHRFRLVPVVIFSSSREETDLLRSYELGANAFIVKPLASEKYQTTLGLIRKFWVELNELPLRPRVQPEAEDGQQTANPSAAVHP